MDVKILPSKKRRLDVLQVLEDRGLEAGEQTSPVIQTKVSGSKQAVSLQNAMAHIADEVIIS